jgi:CelD/BcsL family acetyltransferase involved in cellulose biosynthesis
MLDISLRETVDLVALAERWQALQARADASFFQSWTWVGCLAAERYRRAVVLEATWNGRPVALALFNRPGQGTLFLTESGQPDLDAVCIEHNGILVECGREDLIAACLATVRRSTRRVVLSGVNSAHMRAAGAVLVRQARRAPWVDFSLLRGASFLDTLTANTRYQLSRSARCYRETGPLSVRRASSVDEALGFLDALAALHQTAWTSRGKAGAFANPHFVRFHRALIARGLPRGEIDLLRITAGSQIIGYLYNFRFGGRVSAYQGGFDYAAAGRHQKPGLTCHHLAIETALAEGATGYDFLAGDARYKTSLANAETVLHWVEVVPRWSPRALIHRANDYGTRAFIMTRERCGRQRAVRQER